MQQKIGSMNHGAQADMSQMLVNGGQTLPSL